MIKTKKLISNFSEGFTLIEMIVVFAIIAILATVSIAAFVNYNKSQILQIASSELTSTLNLAKSRAASQAKPVTCDQQILNGYKVVLSTLSNSYELHVVCSDTFEYKIGNTSNLPKNVSFSPDPTSTYFLFPVIVSGVKGSSQPPFTISLTAYGITKNIIIDATGTIR